LKTRFNFLDAHEQNDVPEDVHFQPVIIREVHAGYLRFKRPENSRSSQLKNRLHETQMISVCRSWRASIFEFHRSLFPVAGRGQESWEQHDDGNVAGVFQTGVYQRRRELCFGLCQRARSLRIYDWTYQYADHETWSEAPSSSLSLLASFSVSRNLPISL